MSDERLRLASLTVVGGALDGRRHDVGDVVGEVLVGSDPDCQLCVDLPSISPIHARIWTELGQATARDTSAPRGLYVNSVRVDKEAVFGEGDVLWLGPPNDPESVCIQCRFEPWREILPFTAEPAEAVPAPGEAVAVPTAEALPVSLDEQDPFFIAIEAPAGAPPPPTPAVSAPPAGDTVLPGVPDEAWTIGEAPPELARPMVLPALASQPSPGPSTEDEFFVAAPELGSSPPPPAIAPLSSVPPAPRAPAAPPVAAPKGPGGPPVPARRAAPPAAGAPRPSVPPTSGAAHPVAGQHAPAAPGVRPAAAGPPAPGVPPAAGAPRPAAGPPRAPAPPPAGGAQRPASPGPAAAPPKAAVARPTPPPTRAAGPTRPSPPSARAAQASPAGRSAQASRRPSSRPPAKHRGGLPTWLRVAAPVLVALAVLGALAAWRVLGAVRLDAIDPARVRVGQRAAILGRGFSADPEANAVLFEDKSAKVLAATPVRLEIEVPEAVSEAGTERRVSLRVKRAGRSSNPITVSVLQGPRLHALSPQAAMPGEEVVLAGAGLGLGASVRFGDAPAQVVQAEANRIRVVVPELAGAPGTSAPVVVSVGGVDSNAAPFVVGHLPVITAITPARAKPGELIRVSGLGFLQDPLQNAVQIAGRPALVVSASDSTLEVVVPRVGPGEPARAVAIQVAGGANPGGAILEVPPPAEAIEARFVAEPFPGPPPRPHAVVATGLGPAFVFAASGGRTAAQRAFQAQGRLNQALEVMRTTLGLTVEARGFGASPVIALSGRADVLLEVTAEDAAAYAEDWTALRGRGGAVTRDRLARWWEAVGRDLVLLLVRGEKPRHAAQLAAEGRVLAQLYDASRKLGQPGVPPAALEQGRPPLRDGLRIVGLRVPATVAAPAGAGGPGPASTPPPQRVGPLEGTLRGSELEAGERRYLTATFEQASGSISFEGGLTLTMPLLSLERRGNDQVRFTVDIRGGIRYYLGKWDGQKLVGSISTDEAGREVVGSFELHR